METARISMDFEGRARIHTHLEMAPLIDVVFLLLIFFMTTSSFMRTERNLDPTIRLRETSAATSLSDLEPAIVEVARSDTRFVYRLGGREMTTDRELTQVLRQFPNKVEGAFVQVHDDVPFAMAAAAVQACKTAGFSLVSYVPADTE